jgi:SAM-dependent methyltransferase
MEQSSSFKSKINTVIHHPSIIKSLIYRKKLNEIRSDIDKIGNSETIKFISFMKKNFQYSIDPNQKLKLNRLCTLEDWDNEEFRRILSELQKLNPPFLIHRKDWEWALGIIAMERYNKLNENSLAVGVGSGTEPIPFYLANKVKHVYATDLYGEIEKWNYEAPSNFLNNPKKYAPFPYREDALTVLEMDATKLEFPSELFDIAFSFSSIEHFGGKHHSGALNSMKEIERVLKKGGIAVVATEYIINGKDHPEFFNRKTIYSDLMDKLDSLKLVEPLDLRITTNTLDTVIDTETAANWNNIDNSFRETHPLILLRTRNILLTSVMLVLRKK